MAVQGNKRANTGFSKKVGFFEGEIVSINPNKRELEKLLGMDEDTMEKDPEYVLDNDDDGNKRAVVSVWIRDIKEGQLFNRRFNLIRKERVSKEGNNHQYINDVGLSTWAADVNLLREEKYKWFNNREFRPALVGEEKLYNFLRSWLNDLDYKDMNTELRIDMDAIFKGNVSELRELIDGIGKGNTVLALATVRYVPGTDGVDGADGEKPKEYQSLYDEFLPGNCMKFIKFPNTSRPKFVDYYMKQLEGEYGPKDFFVMEEMRDYNSEENPVASGKPSEPVAGFENAADDLPF